VREQAGRWLYGPLRNKALMINFYPSGSLIGAFGTPAGAGGVVSFRRHGVHLPRAIRKRALGEGR
jgi:hypothetical protein